MSKWDAITSIDDLSLILSVFYSFLLSLEPFTLTESDLKSIGNYKDKFESYLVGFLTSIADITMHFTADFSD